MERIVLYYEKDFFELLLQIGMRNVIILDPGIASRQVDGKIYYPLKDGINDDIFIKNSTGQPLEGKVFDLFLYNFNVYRYYLVK